MVCVRVCVCVFIRFCFQCKRNNAEEAVALKDLLRC